MKERYFIICEFCNKPAFESLVKPELGHTIFADDSRFVCGKKPQTGDDILCQFCDMPLKQTIENVVVFPEIIFNQKNHE